MISKKILFIASVLFCVGCTAAQQELVDRKQELELHGPIDSVATVEIEIANTDETREAGLMFRESLGADSGMLFVFDDVEVRNFWMKNTLLPLDVIFFDEEGDWVSTSTMSPCENMPCISYSSIFPAQYALEVNAGWAKRNAVSEGWKIILPIGR